MYAAYFGLNDQPFAITPDPAYLYMSQRHREALGHLLYGAGNAGGFVQLTGEVGTGKTTLIRTLLLQEMQDIDVALCLNPRLTTMEFVANICDELGISYPENATLKGFTDALNEELLKRHGAGRQVVVIVDEAQQLERDVLEELRLLTNLETHKHKLLRIILVGQPELADVLNRNDLRQLAQRITARYHLTPLTAAETGRYITHRLRVAGTTQPLFTASSAKLIHQLTGGIPRLINVLCDRALLGAYSEEKNQVTTAIIRSAAKEALPGPMLKRQARPAWLGLALAVVLGGIIGAILVAFLFSSGAEPSAQAQPVPNIELSSERAATPAAATATIDRNATSHNAPAKHVPELVTLTETQAQTQLLGLWSAWVGQGRVAANGFCEQLPKYKLRCVSAEIGTLELLEKFNLPAMLWLDAGNGGGWVLLRSLQADQAELLMHGESTQIERSVLAEIWNGPWQVIADLQVEEQRLAKGVYGEDVIWLRKRLAEAAEKPLLIDNNARFFGAKLAKQVQVFQLNNGLAADGIVGGQTLVLLNSYAPSPGAPSLVGEL